MGAALLIARSRLRRNLTATVVLMVLAGLGGGIVMASLAGIRRADEGWATVQRQNTSADALVGFTGPDGGLASTADDDLDDQLAELLEVGEVDTAARVTAVVGALTSPEGRDLLVAANAYLDGLDPALVGRPLIVEGRLPNPNAADEVAIDELMADRLGADVGDRLPFAPFLFDELESASDARDTDPGGTPTDVVVTGIVRAPIDLLPPRTDQFALYSDEPYILLTPAWWDANGPDVGNYGVLVLANLQPGVDLEDLEAAVAERFGEAAFVAPGIEMGVPLEETRAVDRQIGAEGRAVAAFGGTVAVAAVALLVIALARQLGAEGADRTDLRALGLTTRALVLVNVLRSLVIAVGSGLIAILVAVALSAWLPVGVGRRTLSDPGIDVDVIVLAFGFVAVALVVVVLVALVGWRVSRRERVRPRRLSLADRIARAGASPSSTVGVRLAFDPSPSDTGWRTVVGVVALAVAVAVGAAGVVGSLDDLRSSPERLGQAWDASAGNFASPDGLELGMQVMGELDGIDAVGGEVSIGAEIDGQSVTAVAHLPLTGELVPRLVRGRPVADTDEVIMGEALAEDLGVDVGDRVPVSFTFADDPIELDVVGVGPVGAMGLDLDPSRAVLIHDELAARDQEFGVSVLLVRFAEEADRAATAAALREAFPDTVLLAPVPSRSVQTLSGLTALPAVLAVSIALLALAAAATGAIASVRRRRRDLAILKVLGMGRDDVRWVVRWQALTWSGAALLVGLPVGLVLAAIGWREVLRSLGLDSPLAVPFGVMVALVVAAPAVLLALTWWPARQAAATAPAVTLRSE